LTVPLIDHLKDPVAVIARDGRMLAVNNAFSALAGQKKENILGRDCREVEPLGLLWNTVTACILHRREQSECLSYKGLTFEVSIVPVVESEVLQQVFIVLRDISFMVSLERECQKRNKELIVTNVLSSAFISSHNLDYVFSELLEKVLSICELNVGWIVVRQEGTYELKCLMGASGDFRERLEHGRLDVLYENAMNSDTPIYVLESGDIADIEDMRSEGIVFFSAIPLKVEGDVMGFLVLASKTEVRLDFDFASLLSLIGNNLSLIAEKIRVFQEAQRLAVTDSLTGLYNMRYLYPVLDSEVARTIRYSTPFSVVLFDIDDFKYLNDTYGHQAGDEVLRAVADVLKATSRKTDIVARYGGEEFIAVLPNTPKNQALKLASRIKDAVEATVFLNQEAVRITMSGGVAHFPKDAKDAKSLLYAADMAMYEAKAAGKRQICSYVKR
jgi:diguanylate cyclase (GGDEF)-like protein/PAS domain S-box-containing protein